MFMINSEWVHISAVSANLNNRCFKINNQVKCSEKLAKQCCGSTNLYHRNKNTGIPSIKILLNIAFRNHYLDSHCIL